MSENNYSSQTNPQGKTDTDGINEIKKLIDPNAGESKIRYFEPNLNEGDNVAVIDGSINLLIPEKQHKSAGRKYKIHTQVKSTQKPEPYYIKTSGKLNLISCSDKIDINHFWEYSQYKTGFLIINVYPYFEDGARFWWKWMSSIEAREFYEEKRDKGVKKVAIRLENVFTQNTSIKGFHEELYSLIAGFDNAIDINRKILNETARQETLRIKQDNQIKSISEEWGSFLMQVKNQNQNNNIEIIKMLSSSAEIVAISQNIKLAKSIIKDITDQPEIIDTFTRILGSIKIEHSEFWFELSKAIFDKFNSDQEKQIEPGSGVYTQKSVNWINAKYAFVNWLKEYYKQAEHSIKREIESIFVEMVNKTTYKQLQNQCLLTLHTDFEEVPVDIHETLMSIASSDSWVKSTVSDFLKSSEYVKLDNKEQALILIKTLLSNQILTPEYISNGIIQGWRGNHWELEQIGDNIYFILSRNIPSKYQEDDLWLQILLSELCKNYLLSDIEFLESKISDSEVKIIRNNDPIINGYVQDNFTFGFDEKCLNDKITEQEGSYRWFVLLSEFLKKLTEIDRQKFVKDIIRNPDYKRESIYFIIFRTYHNQGWNLPQELETFLNELSEHKKSEYITEFLENQEIPEYIKNYSLKEEWSRDWIGMSSGDAKTVGYLDQIQELIDSGGMEWENYLGLSVKEWKERITDRLINRMKVYRFSFEEEVIPVMLKEIGRKKTTTSLELFNIFKNWYVNPPETTHQDRNNLKFINSCINALFNGVIESDLNLEVKIDFSIQTYNDFAHENYLVADIFRFWQKILTESTTSKEVLIKLKDISIKYVQECFNPEHDKRNFNSNKRGNSGHELISTIINTNIGKAWEILGIHIYQKLEEDKNEIRQIMTREFEKGELVVCGSILYCFLFNGIEGNMVNENGFVFNLVVKTLEANGVTNDGRVELVLLILNRVNTVVKRDEYKSKLQNLFSDFLDYPDLHLETQSMEIFNHWNINYGIFQNIYENKVLNSENNACKAMALKVLAEYGKDYMNDIKNREKDEDYNPLPRIERLKKNLTFLLDWQNEYFRENPQIIGQEEKIITTANFGSFFDPINDSTKIQDVENFWNFWGKEIIDKILTTPYQYAFNLYGRDDFLSKLKDFDNESTDLILLDILKALSKNEFFLKNSEYSMNSFYDSLGYLVGKYKDKLSDSLKSVLKSLGSNENQKKCKLYLQIVDKL